MVRVSVPVPATTRLLPLTGPVLEMMPAKVVDALFPPVVSVPEPRAMELVALALAMEPTVLLKPFRERTPLWLMVTALRPVAPPKALVEPAIRSTLL